MNPEMEKLAGIEPGDSNEVCLAKTMLAVDASLLNDTDPDTALGLVDEGVIYAHEVLNARGE